MTWQSAFVTASTQEMLVVAILIVNRWPEGFCIDQNGDTATSKDNEKQNHGDCFPQNTCYEVS